MIHTIADFKFKALIKNKANLKKEMVKLQLEYDKAKLMPEIAYLSDLIYLVEQELKKQNNK